MTVLLVALYGLAFFGLVLGISRNAALASAGWAVQAVEWMALFIVCSQNGFETEREYARRNFVEARARYRICRACAGPWFFVSGLRGWPP